MSNQLKSRFILSNTLVSSDTTTINFGKQVKWLNDDVLAITSNVYVPQISDFTSFSDKTYFDSGYTNFGEIFTPQSQKINIFQILKTDRNWINSNTDIIKPIIVNNISLNGNNSVDSIYSGSIDNLFIADTNNPNKSLQIYNNSNLSPGWSVASSQQIQLNPESIDKAWIYDSVTNTKIADLEIVDVRSGILPSAISNNIDFISDIDPAYYNIPDWIPGNTYSVGDRITFGNQIYQSIFSGKSSNIFDASVWILLSNLKNFNIKGQIQWNYNQVGKIWFKTKNLKVINAQLGNLSERAQNWNSWFPASSIEVYEWISSNVPPSSYTSNDTNGYILDPNIPYTYDSTAGQYYFWVYNKNSIGNVHNVTTTGLISELSNITNSGIPIISVIDTNSFAVWNINQYISSHSLILHIDCKSKSSNNKLHNEFAIISNDGSKSWMPTSIYTKFVDSLSGVSSTNQLVPDYTIPLSQQTGILNNPVQSLFVNRANALDIYFNYINQNLTNIAIAKSSTISDLTAYDPKPTSGFNEEITDRDILNSLDISLFPENYKILIDADSSLNSKWSIVSKQKNSWVLYQYQTYDLSNYWKYVDWTNPNYSNSNIVPTYTINTFGELSSITYSAGDIIKVNDNGNSNVIILEVNEYNSNLELSPIFLENGTIQFLPTLYNFSNSNIGFDNQGFDSEPFDNDPYIPIRLITQELNDNILSNDTTLSSISDNSFFSILKYILYENKNLDWLFKTSFVSALYNNRNLDIQGNYEPDNQQMIENFLNETLPYHTRIRNFKNIYPTNDFGNIFISDFDLPSQYDSAYANSVYNYTSNPKYNVFLPLNQFRSYTGVFYDHDSYYITSNGVPQSNILVNEHNWSFAFRKYPNTSNIKYDVCSDIQCPEAVSIDGIPIYSANSGLFETLYLYGNVTNPLANVATFSTFTKNSVFDFQEQGYDTGKGLSSNGIFQYLSYPYNLSNNSSNIHSPIIGYSWDGWPIYGPYGYANSDGSGGIILNTSSYHLSNTPRLSNNGISVNGLKMAIYSNPTGEYLEDFEYIQGSGTLDEFNGRYSVTPEYPNGTYAYFSTMSPANSSIPTYPYIIGTCYKSKPYGLHYEYINGTNTPVYLNGNIDIPITASINNVQLIRTPDGSEPTDSITLQNNVYSSWNNHHLLKLSNIIVEKVGAGFKDFSANITVIPSNNTNLVIGSLQSISANLVNGGINYSVGDILSFVGGTYSNAGQILVTQIGGNNSILDFEFINVPNQFYTELPSNIANISTYSEYTIGVNATFNVIFGLQSINIVSSGNNFSNIPEISINDSNLYIQPSVYPVLENFNTRQFDIDLVFDRMGFCENNNEVNVEGGSFITKYDVPNATIFDENDDNSSNISLNLSWNPSLIYNSSLSMEYPRFGNSSGILKSINNQYFYVNPESSDLEYMIIGSNSFTLEFFINFSNINSSNTYVIVDTRNTISDNNGLVIFSNSNTLCIGSNISNIFVTSNSLLFNSNTWNYITIQGNEGNIYSYLNGQLLGNSFISYNFTDSNLTIGSDIEGNYICDAFIDEFRLTNNYNRYTPGVINIDIPEQKFPRTLEDDPYLWKQYTPILWGFENLQNESNANIIFNSANSQIIITDLSWNQKKLQIINYDANCVINGNTLLGNLYPQENDCLIISFNEDQI